MTLEKLRLAFLSDSVEEFLSCKPETFDEVVGFSPFEDSLPLISLAVRFGSRNIFDILLTKSIDPNKVGSWNWSPLLEAIASRDTYFVSRLLEKGADVEQMGGKATTWPLLEAAFTEDERILALVMKQADSGYLTWCIGNLESAGEEKYERMLQQLREELARR